MAALDEIISELGAVVDKIEEAVSVTSSAYSETEQGLDQAAGLGLTGAAEGFSRLKEEIDQLASSLAAAIENANNSLLTARALADGT